MKKLPIGIQTFRKIREDNYYYVDKTHFVKKLSETGGGYFFLSRPRRFGKSLFLDTLASAFLCEKELFKGLYLENQWDWERPHPVIKISFGAGVLKSLKELQETFSEYINEILEREGDIVIKNRTLKGRFAELIRRLSEKYNREVVVLVDEYDKPILDNIESRELALELRDELKNYYSVIKDSDRYIKLCFITGVSKFSKVNLFSGLNNLNDITLDAKFGSICGYTESELYSVFADYLSQFNRDKVKKWYNGYSFTGNVNTSTVYNPYDILLLFNKNEFKNYWFETGTPSFLIKLLTKKNYYIPEIEEYTMTGEMISSFDVDNIEIETLLFQTGYLTIKEKIQKGNRILYVMNFPNMEVKMSLTENILKTLSNSNSIKEQNNLYDALYNGDVDGFRSIFLSFFSSIPNDWYRKNSIGDYEGYYASIVYCYFSAIGVEVIPEDVTNRGRIDLTVKLEDKIYIIEFKVVELNSNKSSALEQIKERKYYEKYRGKNNKIYLIGVEFSKTDRNITRYQWEEV